jgi:hypothetical protein
VGTCACNDKLDTINDKLDTISAVNVVISAIAERATWP